MRRGDEGDDALHDESDLHGEERRVLQPRARATEPVPGNRGPQFDPSLAQSKSNCVVKIRVSEPEPPGAGVFGWSRSRHFGPAPAPP